MTQHLWLAWGSTYEPNCRHAPEWDYLGTTVEFGHALWQGEGPRCKLCIKQAHEAIAHLCAILEANHD